MVLLRKILKLVLGLSGLLVIIIAVVGLFLSNGKKLSERHQPFELAADFDFSTGSYQEYISFSQNHLRAARTDSPADQLIQNASPFVLEPGPECPQEANGKYENGVVLTHGLLASPYSMLPIGEYFQSRCFYVLGILMPDHVTRPGDFIATQWEDWAAAQHYALEQLQQKTDKQFLSGHSVGGALAVYEAAINPAVDGIILFTPALQISPATKYAKYVTWLARLFPKAGWYELRDDEARYRYESITMSAGNESYLLIQAINEALADKPLSIPVFTVASVQDNTVDTDATLAFMAQQEHLASKTLLYSQYPQASSANVVVQLSYAPEQGVLSVSHLGIMLPASHPEYGREGAYRSCGHYWGGESDNLAQCQSGQRDYYGEVTEENLQQGLIERIAFNPFYNGLLTELDSFLDNQKGL